MARTRSGLPHEVDPAEGPRDEDRAPLDDQPPDADRPGGIRGDPRGQRAPTTSHGTSPDHPQAERRREVVGQDQLVVGGVVQRLPRDDRDREDGQQREQPEDRDAAGPGRSPEVGRRRACPRHRPPRARRRSRCAPPTRPPAGAAAKAATPPTSRPRSARASRPTASRPSACSRAHRGRSGPRSASAGRAPARPSARSPPPARNPASPSAHETGRTSVTTNAAREDASQIGRRPARSGAAALGATAAVVMARGWAPATRSAARAPRARPGPWSISVP